MTLLLHCRLASSGDLLCLFGVLLGRANRLLTSVAQMDTRLSLVIHIANICVPACDIMEYSSGYHVLVFWACQWLSAVNMEYSLSLMEVWFCKFQIM